MIIIIIADKNKVTEQITMVVRVSLSNSKDKQTYMVV